MAGVAEWRLMSPDIEPGVTTWKTAAQLALGVDQLVRSGCSDAS